MAKTKLIDLRVEKALAKKNVDTYLKIRKTAVWAMGFRPQWNGDEIIDKLCNQENLPREDFDLICSVERTLFEDFLRRNSQ